MVVNYAFSQIDLFHDSVDGDEEENDDASLVWYNMIWLTMATAVMGRVVGMPVLYQRKEMLHALDQSESRVVLGGYAGSSRQRN